MNVGSILNKRKARHTSTVLLLLALLASSTGTLRAEQDLELDEAIPSGRKLTAIEAFPDSIELTNRYSYRQVVLTGTLDSGERLDVTRLASVEGDLGLVSVSPTRIVRAVKDGDATLRFKVEDLHVDIPVKVSGREETFTADYIQHIQPILSKVGCNGGTCHGSLKGKNGFKLSLRGFDYAYDHTAITDDHGGRRFNRAAPVRSLFLMKTSGVVPHVGGVVLLEGKPYYEILKAWVEQGVRFNPDTPRVSRIELFPENPVLPLPGMKQQFAVLAHFADGSWRDVSAEAFIETNNIEVTAVNDQGTVSTLRRGEAAIMARYEGRYAATQLFVMGDRSGFVWKDVPELNRIDTLVYEKLKTVKTEASGLCTDAEFMRRIYLDLTGLPPSAREVRTFLMDERDSGIKRDELIDRLIGNVEFVEHWSNKWADLLQVNRKFLGLGGAKALRDWIRQGVVSNKPYDRFCYELLTASGSSLKNPPAAYFRTVREPDGLMENTTQLFLGVRFNCNKCHDHPFERWTQKNHWELAAFFAQVERKKGPGGKDEEIIGDKNAGEVTAPYSGQIAAPHFPYEHKGEIPEKASRRERLARWITSVENPYFARSYVNRLWSYFLGVGIIDPIDDIRAGNPPTNPALLEFLTREFVDNGFDVRHVIRLICGSAIYQQSIRTTKWNEDDQINFSHALARRLSAETLYDAVHRVTGSVLRIPGVRVGTRSAELPDPAFKPADGFLELFGRPPRESVCECERSSGMSLGQALNLVNGPTIAEAVKDPQNDISNLVSVEKNPGRILEELFLSILNRMPTEEENSLAASLDPLNLETAAALEPADAEALSKLFADWKTKNRAALWVPLETGIVKTQSGVPLQPQKDGSYLASGEAPDKDVYTVVAWTDLAGLTGVRLEVLPDEKLGKTKGPGRAKNGNFVLSEFRLTANSATSAEAKAVVLQNATTTVNQKDFDVARAIDNKADTGWGIGKGVGKRQRAVFEAKENFGVEGGTILTFRLEQQHGDKHLIGKFRLDVTQAPRPVRLSTLPENIQAILAIDPAKHSPEQTGALFRHYIAKNAAYVAKIRLAAVQDMAWALINSPAFLFNR